MSVLTNSEDPEYRVWIWRFAGKSMVGPDCMLSGKVPKRMGEATLMGLVATKPVFGGVRQSEIQTSMLKFRD